MSRFQRQRTPGALGLLLIIVGGSFVNANAAETYATLEPRDPRFHELIPADARIEKIADDLLWSEGPLWDARTKTLLFSDIPRNRIMQWHAEKGVTVFLERSGYTGAAPFTGKEPGSNGLTFDPQGRLTLCQHGDRRVSRREPDGKMTPLAVGFQGKKLNSPNDLVFAPDGSLWFTDPPFGLPKMDQDPGKEVPFNGVYRYADGKLQAVVTDLTLPNGLAFSPDGKTLYVANFGPERFVKAYDIGANGALTTSRMLIQYGADEKRPGGPDGLKVDSAGNIWTTGPGGIRIVTPQGKVLGQLVLPEVAANLAFAQQGKFAYITATSSIYRLPVRTPGTMPLYQR